jgi:CDP-diacylglycerol--glycerol-3-phosphate 3-phosphatidyltransferase
MVHERPTSDSWKTKPTDRFILKWIKCHLSARITPRLLHVSWLRPWILTVFSAGLGIIAGIIYATGVGWLAGLTAAISQVFDGVDGQYARLTDRQSPAGAFWDSVLDRFADGAMMIGMILYLVRLPVTMPLWVIIIFGSLALIGSNGVSYSTSRAENLGIDLGRPTLASKGTRSTVMILCALGTVVWPALPLLALMYLVIHPNTVLIMRLVRAHKGFGYDR